MDAPGSLFVAARGSAHDARPTALAQYRNLGDARHAIQSLESGGVDGDDLSLVGETARTVERRVVRSRSDSRILTSVTRGIVVGALLGAALCAVIGAAFVGVLLLVWSGLDDRGWVFGLLVCWFAAGGAVLGSFVGVSRTLGFSESLPLTLEDDPGHPIWLAIYGSSPEVLRSKLDVTHPMDIVEDPDTVTAHPDNVEPQPRSETVT
jgi:hypothetical protein